jgi:nephrocystin-3
MLHLNTGYARALRFRKKFMNFRIVRIFLSSTFRDFGEERDLLVKRVFPALRAKLKDRFVELVDVDLRWGITVEEAERGEVLPICLAEIDRSRPYFIGMLGERYGWIPPYEGYAPDLLERQPWLKKHQGGKSVTELEILHGVLKNKPMKSRAFFYFRSPVYARAKSGHYVPDTIEDRKRQLDLKQRIKDSGYSVTGYRDPEALAKRMERDLWKLLDAEFPASKVPDAFERESMRHEAYAAPKRRLYLGGDAYIQTLNALLKQNANRILITGQSGGGKSALLANAMVKHSNSKTHLLEHYLGSSSDAADAVALVRRVIDYIRRVTGNKDPVAADTEELFESVPDWLAIASAFASKNRTRWLFVLDAIDNLNGYRDLQWFPAYLPERIQIVVSCLEGEVLEVLETKGTWDSLVVKLLDSKEQRQLLTEYLKRFNKSLSADLLNQALGHPLANNPLWLTTLAEELRLFGSHEELSFRLDTLLGAPKGKDENEQPTLDDLFEHVLQRVEGDQGRKLVRDALCAIWASRAGLSEPELLEILAPHSAKTGKAKKANKLPPAQWALVRNALDEMLLESGGRIIFAHGYVKTAVKDRYLPSESLVRTALQ